MLGVLFGKFIGWLMGKLFGAPKVSTDQQLGQSQANLDNEASANAQFKTAADARAAADAARVRNDPNTGHVTTDPAAAINTNPDARFRD